MTIDDDSSVYVGGLPYDATEASIRRVFSRYGSVIAVKIVNDHATRGKCYGFVTFTNPRSVYDAINDMNGRTISGRVVRVNEVTTRGNRSNFSRDHSRHSEWDRGHDRERDHDHDRDRGLDRERDRNHDQERYRDRYSDRSGEHDRSRDYDAERERVYDHYDHGRNGEYSFNRDHDRDEEANMRGESKDHSLDRERNNELNVDQNGEIDGSGTNGHHRSADGDKEQQLRWDSSINNDQHSRGLSTDSSDDYNQMRKELEREIQSREELKKQISLMEVSVEERQNVVLDLQKKSKTLEDALIAAKKLSSRRKTQLAKLHKRFLQVKECREKLKSCEQELQSLVDSTMLESEDDVDARGTILANGIA